MTSITDNDTLQVLREIKCNGNMATLPARQLDRALYTKVNKVLEALGGKWNKKLKGHVFPNDAATTLTSVVDNASYHDSKKEDAFFPTPPYVADAVMALVNLQSTHRVLEPSAGTGALVIRALQVVTAQNIVAIEINLDRVMHLKSNFPGVRAHHYNFLKCLPSEFGKFDRIIMNPPFTRGVDLKHVSHALEFLVSGGRLVSVIAGGRTKKTVLESLQCPVSSCNITSLPDKSFKGSGTSVATSILVLDR
jgi:predicted RNA methylase